MNSDRRINPTSPPLALEFVVNAISKPDIILEPVEDVKIAIEPIPVASILTKSNRFYTWMERWTERSYEAWEKAGKPYRE